jgi:hypothetical protein
MATKKTPSNGKMEFEALKNSKPGAAKRAQKFDDKSDKAIAKKFGVKYKG